MPAGSRLVAGWSLQNISLSLWPRYFNSSEAVTSSQAQTRSHDRAPTSAGSGPFPFIPVPTLHTSFLSLDLHRLTFTLWMLLISRYPSLGSTAHTAPPDPHSHRECDSHRVPVALPPRSPPESVIPHSCVHLVFPSTELCQGKTCVLLSKVAPLFITGQESSGWGFELGSPRAPASPIQQLPVPNFHDSHLCHFSPLVTTSLVQSQNLPS